MRSPARRSFSPIHISNSPAHGSTISRRISPESCCNHVPPKHERARGMPDAGRTHGPPAEKKQAAVTTGSAGTTGIPRATVLTLIRSLPGAPGLLATIVRAARLRHRERDTSIGASGPCDFTSTLHRSSARPKTRCGRPRPSLPASRVVTIARNAPLVEAGWAEIITISEIKQYILSRSYPDERRRRVVAHESGRYRSLRDIPQR